MQEDSANDLKMLQEWFETNRIRETGIVENVQKQPASPERDEMLETVSNTHLTLPTILLV